MGLQGRKWNDCQGEEKDRLRQRFDQIKASVQNPHSGIEHILNKIAVVEKRPWPPNEKDATNGDALRLVKTT